MPDYRLRKTRAVTNGRPPDGTCNYSFDANGHDLCRAEAKYRVFFKGVDSNGRMLACEKHAIQLRTSMAEDIEAIRSYSEELDG